uniref:Uncharacterized protein n=1 Tax=Anguilla anguilla TaxID=7936 RepID=A0A0E9UT41_ANGAN
MSSRCIRVWEKADLILACFFLCPPQPKKYTK